MVLPTRRDKESQDAFISRCMGNDSMKKEFPDQKQRAAVCHSQLGKSGKMVNVLAPITKVWTEKVQKGEGEMGEHTFFEATISGMKPDRDDERMSEGAVKGMINKLKEGTVPLFPDHGRDPSTGERNYSWKQIMGVWVDGRVEGESLKAVARLNNAHPDTAVLKSYLEQGMPVSFSIGARTVKVGEEEYE